MIFRGSNQGWQQYVLPIFHDDKIKEKICREFEGDKILQEMCSKKIRGRQRGLKKG
jgi:hypothetical protein